ncbi:MAG TPA: hypothetical protein RMH99_12310, partial [Sandaracinaceae bacterium LLY-WYZ-13_1]|nr:hypothetical protein [Sandaracinaceae bacterium LLY-WYZ-13_1]
MAETERSWVPWLGAAAIVAAVGWWVVEQRARPGVPPAERAPRAGDEDGDGASPPVASDLPTPDGPWHAGTYGAPARLSL